MTRLLYSKPKTWGVGFPSVIICKPTLHPNEMSQRIPISKKVSKVHQSVFFSNCSKVGSTSIFLVGGDWNIWIIFPFSWECHHPNWRTPSFFRGVGQPPTSSACFWIFPTEAQAPRLLRLQGLSGLAALPGPGEPAKWRSTTMTTMDFTKFHSTMC